MNRKKLKTGDEVVLVARPATVGWSRTAATSVADGYWVARVIDAETTYPGWRGRQGVKPLPGVKVRITDYIPGEREDPTVKPYKPGNIGNQPGGGTVVKTDSSGKEFAAPADDGTDRGMLRRYLPGDTVTVGARLIVNTTTENSRLLAAKKAARAELEAEQAEKAAASEALAARYAALGIKVEPLRSSGTVKIETKPDELIKIIEGVTT